MKPNILCLQEWEDDDELNNLLINEQKLEKVFWKKKTEKDGLATYYDVSKFKKVAHFVINYDFNMYSELYCKDRACLYVVLKSKVFPKKYFIVANTHLNFNTKRGDIKMA